MFNIAQFRKFDLLLLINVMSSSPRSVVNMQLGQRSCLGLDLRFA